MAIRKILTKKKDENVHACRTTSTRTSPTHQLAGNWSSCNQEPYKPTEYMVFPLVSQFQFSPFLTFGWCGKAWGGGTGTTSCIHRGECLQRRRISKSLSKFPFDGYVRIEVDFFERLLGQVDAVGRFIPRQVLETLFLDLWPIFDDACHVCLLFRGAMNEGGGRRGLQTNVSRMEWVAAAAKLLAENKIAFCRQILGK